MLGAMIGDIVGSVYEWHNIKTTDFEFFKPNCTFTDDTVLTAATAQALLTDGDYTRAYQDFSRRYPGRGYGGRYAQWIWAKDPQPYYSWGNGSAMRVSPVGFAFDTVKEVLAEAKRSAAVTHNHPEGIKGAQATALAILLARQGADQAAIRDEITGRFGYDLSRTLDDIRPGYQFNESCQQTVPEAITAILESTDFENAIRLASLWVAIAIPWRTSPGESQRPFMASGGNCGEGENLLTDEFLGIVEDFGKRKA